MSRYRIAELAVAGVLGGALGLALSWSVADLTARFLLMTFGCVAVGILVSLAFTAAGLRSPEEPRR
jgi:hypothetical protein